MVMCMIEQQVFNIRYRESFEPVLTTQLLTFDHPLRKLSLGNVIIASTGLQRAYSEHAVRGV